MLPMGVVPGLGVISLLLPAPVSWDEEVTRRHLADRGGFCGDGGDLDRLDPKKWVIRYQMTHFLGVLFLIG
jgi:hypothetical protein